jgi:zinc and cadmium transporter
MLISQIVLATLLAGIGSVWLAAFFSYCALARFNQHLLSLAAGALLSTAFMNLLPEAFESAAARSIAPHALFTALLMGLVFFFLLDKAELYHHGHEHGSTHAGHAHHGHPHEQAHEQALHQDHSHVSAKGGWAVLLGDSLHAFGDGIVIAAAFIAAPALGWAAALAVLAHEVPHHMGDLIVLGKGTAQDSKRAALVKVSLAGTVTAIGGLLGYLLLAQLSSLLPYVLVVAGSSFIYVALADLIPQLQKRMSLAETTKQVAWLLMGMGLVIAVTGLSH